MYIDKHRRIFYMSKVLKFTRPGFQQLPLEFLAYPADKYLCMVWLISLFLGKTSALIEEHESFFFISYVDPYKPVSPKPIAPWVLKTLGKSNINMAIFKADSTFKHGKNSP